MLRWLGLVFISLLLCLHTHAIEATVGYTIFYKPANNGYKSYIETYWQIIPGSLHFTEPETGKIIAKIRTDISFINEEGKTVKEDHYLLQTPAATHIDLAVNQNIIELQRYLLPAGKYKVQLTLTELIDTTSHYSFADSFEITDIAQKPAYSNLQLLDTSYVWNEAQQNLFSKNNMLQIPLCAAFVDSWRRSLFYYSELYYPTAASRPQNKLVQTVSISKKPLENAVFNLKKNDTIAPNAIQAVMPATGKLNIESLPSGNYYLNIVLKENATIVASQSLFFQRINLQPVAVNTPGKTDSFTFEEMQFFDLNSTFVSKYTLPQLKAILKMIKPISNSIEVLTIDNFIAKPDEMYIRYFIYNFWKERNPTDPKAAWDAYTDKVKEVNKRFAAGNMPGYETERGVIYLKYGKPEEMVTVENEQGTEPYEIWSYNTLAHQRTGGMILFYRPGFSFGEYRVLHSNIRGEVRNTGWRSILYKTGRSNTNNNARAEQYFPGNK